MTVQHSSCQVAGARSGISLMEVLIAIFVVAIGLLGVAALIPVANYALQETSKADRTAACGQAALREVRVRRLLSLIPAANLAYLHAGHAIVVDPLLFANGIDRSSFGDEDLVRSHVHTQAWLWDPDAGPMTLAEAERIFYWHDDLLFDVEEDTLMRPVGFDLDGNGEPDGPIPERGYSWFFTVSPKWFDAEVGYGSAGTTPQFFTVSVVVCQGRDFATQEQAVDLTDDDIRGVLPMPTPGGTIISGIGVANRPDLEPGQWVLLYGPDEGGTFVAQWYRIAAGAGDYFAMEGPMWPSLGGNDALPVRLISLPGVLGVYTRTIGIE